MLPALPILAAVTVIALLAIAAWGLVQVRLQTVVRHRGPVRRVAVPLLLLGLLLPTVAQASPAPVPLRWRSSAVASGQGEISSGRASREGSPFGENRTSGFRLFLQVDPSGYVDSPNLYAGFANDPVNHRDPTGRDACGWLDSDEECRAKIRAGSDRNDAAVRATGRSPLRDTAKVYTLGLAAAVSAPIGAATSVPVAAAMGTAGAYSGVGIGLGLSAGIAAPLVVGTALVAGSPSDADRAAAVVASTATPLTLAGATIGAGIAGERGYFTGAVVGGGAEVAVSMMALALGPRLSPCGPSGCGGPGVCFVAGTEVQTAQGPVAIEHLKVGDRVLTDEECLGTSVGDDWALFVIRMPHPDGFDDVIDLRMLRPLSWLRERGGSGEGSWVEVNIDEMGLAGPGMVLAVEPVPALSTQRGCLVLSTVTHQSYHVVELRFEEGDSSLEPTSEHRLFSFDRQDWVAAGDLRPGDHLATSSGFVTVQTTRFKPDRHRVFNIEVETRHAYYVSDLDVLSHNAGDCLARPLTQNDLGLAANAKVEGTLAIRGQKATVKIDYLGKPAGTKGGLGTDLFSARDALAKAVRAEGASTLRIETSPIIEETGVLRQALERRGFQSRANGTMWWEGGIEP